MKGSNPNLDFVNMKGYIKFGELCSQDIEQKRDSNVDQGP